MNNDQAKLILGVYRPTGEDADDRFFSEALERVRHDPAMAAWFDDQRCFDARIAAALAAYPVPADGKIVTGISASRPVARRRWWPLALAAGIAFVLSATVFLRQPSAGLPLPENATLAQIAINLAEHHGSIGLMSADLARVRQWLTGRQGPLPGALPPGLARMTVLGCETWSTTRGRVSLICFVGEGKQVAHLYIFENVDDHHALPELDQPRLQREGNWLLASWRDDARAYVLGAPADTAINLETLFRS